jgi:hypothetical protein
LGTITDAAAPAATEATGFDLRGFLWRSIMLGVVIALFSGPLAIVVTGMVDGFVNAGANAPPAPPSWAIEPSVGLADISFWIILVWALIVAPIGESLIFVAVYWALKRLPVGRTLFVAVMGIFAYFAHGGAPANIAQAAGFMLMAAWYAHLSRRYPSPSRFSRVKIPYYGIALAHFAWNATAILWMFGIASLVGYMTGRMPF